MTTNHRTLLVGSSHANCIAASIRSNLYQPSSQNYVVRVVAHGATALPGGLVLTDSQGREVANPIMLKAIQGNTRLRPKPAVWVVSVLGGNHASRLSLFRQAAGYWMSGDDGKNSAAGGTFIPEDLLVATLTRQLDSLRSFLRLIGNQDVAGVIHVEAPPPVRSAEHIVAHLPAKTLALAKSNGLDQIGPDQIGDAGFRLRVWQCQAQATQQSVQAEGAHYLLPPSEALDPDGFLAQRYWADAMHASPEYGAAVLRMIEEYIIKISRETESEQES